MNIIARTTTWNAALPISMPQHLCAYSTGKHLFTRVNGVVVAVSEECLP